MRCVLVVIVGVLAACGGGGSSPECAGLELADCRVAEGCKPDQCFACSCTPGYRGCIAALAQPEACPDLGCPSPLCCSSQDDCPDTTACAPPGSTPGCGACNNEPGTCDDDAACKPQGATMICEPITCSCEGNKACVPGCVANTDCTEGLVCDVSLARCVAQPCEESGLCPPNFSCNGTSCARTTCTDDLDCDGFCVDGSCFDARGECIPPAA